MSAQRIPAEGDPVSAGRNVVACQPHSVGRVGIGCAGQKVTIEVTLASPAAARLYFRELAEARASGAALSIPGPGGGAS